MKRIFAIFSAVAFIVLTGCSQTPQPAAAQKVENMLAFENTTHDYGNIPQGGDGTYEFVFKNTGAKPVILTNVRSSCGCTIPEWPREPIASGQEARIKVRYNTQIAGRFSKKISVYADSISTPIVLSIKGNVEAAEQK